MSQLETEEEDLELDAEMSSDEYVDRGPVRPKRMLRQQQRPTPIPPKKPSMAYFWIHFVMQLVNLIVLLALLSVAVKCSDQMSRRLQCRGVNGTETPLVCQ
jgi:hypothetical protein